MTPAPHEESKGGKVKITDKMRLDWLSKGNDLTCDQSARFERFYATGANRWHKTARLAIDAVIRQEKREASK